MLQTLNLTQKEITTQDNQNQPSNFEEYLKSLIEVTEPYYALENLSLENDEILKASIKKQLACKHEVKGMSYSEAGRHLAILGSLALANSNPLKEKHYYLANKAYVERVYQEAYDEVDHIGYMKTVSFNRKNAIAEGHLTTTTGEIIYKIKVEYSVLTASLFERMFKKHKQETNKPVGFNPYKDSIPLYDIVKSKEQCSASMGLIKKEVCVGHFDDYPALPVARIAQILTAMASIQNNIIEEILKPIKIKRVILYANSFLFAGETMNLKSTYDSLPDNNNESFIDTFAYKNNETKHSARLSCWI